MGFNHKYSFTTDRLSKTILKNLAKQKAYVLCRHVLIVFVQKAPTCANEQPLSRNDR